MFPMGVFSTAWRNTLGLAFGLKLAMVTDHVTTAYFAGTGQLRIDSPSSHLLS
jgi:hypothetical protein